MTSKPPLRYRSVTIHLRTPVCVRGTASWRSTGVYSSLSCKSQTPLPWQPMHGGTYVTSGKQSPTQIFGNRRKIGPMLDSNGPSQIQSNKYSAALAHLCHAQPSPSFPWRCTANINMGTDLSHLVIISGNYRLQGSGFLVSGPNLGRLTRLDPKVQSVLEYQLTEHL